MGLALRTDLLPARQVQDLPPLPSREAGRSRLSKRHNGRGPVSGKPEQRCGRLFSGTRLKPGSGRPQHSSFLKIAACADPRIRVEGLIDLSLA
jgi:hypothetical protein